MSKIYIILKIKCFMWGWWKICTNNEYIENGVSSIQAASVEFSELNKMYNFLPCVIQKNWGCSHFQFQKEKKHFIGLKKKQMTKGWIHLLFKMKINLFLLYLCRVYQKTTTELQNNISSYSCNFFPKMFFWEDTKCYSFKEK